MSNEDFFLTLAQTYGDFAEYASVSSASHLALSLTSRSLISSEVPGSRRSIFHFFIFEHGWRGPQMQRQILKCLFGLIMQDELT
ncbi:hypothetical protein LNP17_11835 [Klebsiella variicola subsp. variicola]|nr:hypothetical protein [Klebsiella variicola subsp. variicola]